MMGGIEGVRRGQPPREWSPHPSVTTHPPQRGIGDHAVCEEPGRGCLPRHGNDARRRACRPVQDQRATTRHSAVNVVL